MLKNNKIAIIATLIAMLLWGSAIPTIKTTYEELGVGRADTGAQLFIAGIRFFLAGILGFVYLKAFNKEKIVKEDISYKYILVLSLTQTFVQYLIYYIALSNTAGVKAAIIQRLYGSFDFFGNLTYRKSSSQNYFCHSTWNFGNNRSKWWHIRNEYKFQT